MKGLGIDAPKYDENVQQKDPNLGVHCNLGPLFVTFFRGDVFGSMTRGAKEAMKKGGMKEEQGPKIGSDAYWFSQSGYTSVMFVTTGKKYSVNLSGPEKALLEKTAVLLEAKLDTK